MYKISMRLATIDSVATTQTLRDNLQNLGVFAVTVNSFTPTGADMRPTF